MSTPMTVRLVRLADQLGDLRLRLKQAARFEVAQAIAEALSEATRSLICGSVHSPSMSRQESSNWDDPWHDPLDDDPSWTHERDLSSVSNDITGNFASYQTALMTGLAVARWSFTRTGQPAAALGLAAFAAVFVLIAGKRIAPLLDVCSVAQELLNNPNRRA